MENASEPETTQLNIRDFPAELYRKVKMEAARRGVTLKAFVIATLDIVTRGKE